MQGPSKTKTKTNKQTSKSEKKLEKRVKIKKINQNDHSTVYKRVKTDEFVTG